MNNPLYKRSPQPLYLQVAGILRRNIESGRWAQGSQVPPLDELTKTLEVSRTTLRQAFGLLSDEGLISRARGTGTFVRKRPAIAKLPLPTTWQQTVELSKSLGTTTLRESSDDVALPDYLWPENSGNCAGRYQYWRRIHTSQGNPFCYTEVYLDRDLYLQNPQRYCDSTIAPVLDELHRKHFTCARQFMSIIEAGSDSAQALQIPVSSPVAQLYRYAQIGKRVVYVARLEIPTRLVQMEQDLLASEPDHV